MTFFISEKKVSSPFKCLNIFYVKIFILLRVVAPSKQARMAMNPKDACDADSCADPKTGVPTFNKKSGSAMRLPSARHAECQRRIATTIMSQQSSEQQIHEALNHRYGDRTSN